MTEHPEPIKIDFKNRRENRQNSNYEIVYNSLYKNNKKIFFTNINKNQLERLLLFLKITEEQLFEKCQKDDLFCKTTSMLISKNATRQSSRDENEQLTICNTTLQKYGIEITILSSTELRPSKDGKILSKNDMKTKCIQKDECLKSFDGKISGKINGFISSKISFGKGGHQDNVFIEQDNYASWWTKYKNNSNDILVLLIDTDLEKQFERLKLKYIDIKNILVCSHIEFQEHIIERFPLINTYCNDESI